jgi:hypothetical protein
MHRKELLLVLYNVLNSMGKIFWLRHLQMEKDYEIDQKTTSILSSYIFQKTP